MIDSHTAAEVARRHRLTLGDAAALARLADTEAEADELAAQFAPPAEDPDPVRDFARGMFARALED